MTDLGDMDYPGGVEPGETTNPPVRIGAERGRVRCAYCGEPATCVGLYENGSLGGACDEHCGHGNEDGWCEPVADPARWLARASEALDDLREDLREAEGLKIQGNRATPTHDATGGRRDLQSWRYVLREAMARDYQAIEERALERIEELTRAAATPPTPEREGRP